MPVQNSNPDLEMQKVPVVSSEEIIPSIEIIHSDNEPEQYHDTLFGTGPMAYDNLPYVSSSRKRFFRNCSLVFSIMIILMILYFMFWR